MGSVRKHYFDTGYVDGKEGTRGKDATLSRFWPIDFVLRLNGCILAHRPFDE